MTSDRFRVLVIDDDKDILDLIHYTLSPHYEVLTVHDSTTACEILDIFEPDLAIVDIMMPKVTGYQLVEFMKQNQKFQNLVIVFLSAKDSPRDIKYGYKLGVHLYLTKPFQPERLLKNVQSLLDYSPTAKPGKKMYSMRDVTLRMQLKAGHYVPLHDSMQSSQTPMPDQPPPPKFKRPLGQQAAEDAEGKKWVG
jgi:DNA-binding response OmpR family regulator